MRLVFASDDVEARFAVFLALRGRRLALALCGLTLALWLSAFTRIALLAVGASTLVARRAVLLAATATGCAMQGLAIQTLADPAKAAFHEQVKTRQTLVSMMVCMVCAILANPDELNLKAPVAMFVSRSMFHLAERYRLMTLLHLQWVNLVCFAMQEADLALWSRKTGGSRAAGAVALDLLVVLVLGEAVPLFIGAAWEARLRREFLRRTREPAAQLGPFWAACMRWTAAPP